MKQRKKVNFAYVDRKKKQSIAYHRRVKNKMITQICDIQPRLFIYKNFYNFIRIYNNEGTKIKNYVHRHF